MYIHNAKQMILPHEFFLPFAGTLNPENQWCKLAAIVPWDKAEELYISSLGELNVGQKAYSVRMALGALIIQNRKNLSDRETVDEIVENPYLQYFIGLSGFVQKPPFDASLLVHFRKRLGKDIVNRINELIALDVEDDNHEDPEPPSSAGSESEPESDFEGEQLKTKGVLLLDATCVPADIAFPTDTKLLNNARESLEEIIDVLHKPHIGKRKKPRTYRRRARKEFLRFERKRIHTKKEIRRAVGQQLRYVKRDLNIIERLAEISPLTLLDRRQHRNLLIVNELYRQQFEMFDERKHQVADRIVSLSMPFVRPIVRGKSNAPVEFGPKLAISIVNGFTFMEKLSFDAFNEGITLRQSAENYRARHGCYPEAIIADKIYRNRENLAFCKENGIRLSGPPLGRPPKDLDFLRELRKQERKDASIRNAVEGKFGEGKRFYGLGRIMTRLQNTCETVISLQLLVLNLERRLRILYAHFLNRHFLVFQRFFEAC